MKRFTQKFQLRRHTKLKRFSRSATSIILAACLLVSCMTVGLIATDAAKVTGEKVGDTNRTIYIYPADLWSDYASYTIKVNVNIGDNNTWRSATFTNTGKTINGKVVYTATFSEKYGGVDEMQIQKYQGSTWKDQKVPFSTWTTYDNFAGKIYNGSSWATRPDYDVAKIKGITGDWNTTGEINMTLDSGNNYYYAVTGDGNDKYYRLRYGLYYDAHENNFDLVNGSGGPYDGSTDNKKYGLHQADGNAFKLPTSADYNYRIYFDISGKKTWFTKTEKTHSVSIKQQLGSGSATNVSTATIGNVTGVSVTANASVTSGGNSYTFDHWAISGGAVKISSTQNGTYTSYAAGSNCTTRSIYVKTAADNAVLTAVYTLDLPNLSAPTNVKLNGSAANCTVDATTVGQKINLTWDTVTNAGSYKVYKGTSLVATVTTNSYGIERAASSNGEYTVVAVPSDATQYNESTNSTGYTLTVNKKKLTQPTVSVSSTDIKNGDSIQLTVTDTNTSYTAAQYDYYYYTGSTPTISDTYKLTAGTPKTLSPTSDTTYKVIAYPKNGSSNDYYTQSDAKSADEVKVYSAPYKIAGSLVDTQWSYSAGIAFSNYVGEGVFYYQTSSLSSGTYHFSLYDSSDNQYSGDNNDTNCVITLGEENQYTLTKNTNHKSFEVTGSGVFFVYYDTVNGKIWVTQTTWTITPHVYYKTFNLQTNSYNTAQSGTTGGTINPDSETLVTKTTSTTLTATAKTGYTFDGWYNNSDFAAAHKVHSNASYTFTPTASGDYYALFKQIEPAHYNLNVASAANVTVTATYNGTTLQEGGATLSVPVGASVSYTITLDTGCQLDSTTPSGLTTGTHTFTMPAANTTVTVNASKINYTLTPVVSPSYGTLKFYSNSACTTEITTAQYNQTFYAKYTSPSGNAYDLNSFSVSGTGTSLTNTNHTTNVGTFKMGTANATITASVKAATPTFNGTWPTSIEVYANESFTYSGGTVSPSGTTVTYTYNGSSNTTGTFTAQATKGTYTMTITASNKPTGISTAATASKIVNVTVKFRENSVTYYVDMHGNDMNGKKVQVSIVTGSNSTTPVKDNNGNDCKALLTQVGSSSVYSATITTPVVMSSPSEYNNLYVRVNYGAYSGSSFTSTIFAQVTTLASNQVTGLVGNQVTGTVGSQTMWMEAVNDSSVSLRYTTGSTVPSPVADGFRRIYVAKPYGWESSETSWTNIGIYYWGNNTQNIGWNSNYNASTGIGCVHMSYLGYDSSDGHHYYYADIPKTITETVNNVTTTYKVHSLIFQGWGSNQTNGSFSKTQTDNIDISADSANYFKLTNESGYSAVRQTDAVMPSYTKRYSSVVTNMSETGLNIAPTYKGADIKYETSNGNVVMVSGTGALSLRQKGTATITVKIYGTIGNLVKNHEDNDHKDYLTYTTTVTVHDPTSFQSIDPMSLDTAVYTVQVPTVNSDQPGYFDLSGTSVEVSGLKNGATSSAIINRTAGTAEKPTAFTVTYAKSTPTYFPAYQDISLTGTVVTKSLTLTGSGERYGLKEWRLDPGNALPSPAYLTQKSITGSVETVTTSGIAFSTTYTTYKAIFEKYEYVDVTFTFNYYEYNPELVEGEMINYPYDSDWAGTETFGNTFNKKVFTVNELENTLVKGDWSLNTTAGANTPSVTLDISSVSSLGGNWCAWTWGENEGRWITGTKNGNIITFADDDVDNNIIFVRLNDGDAVNWENMQNKTVDLSSRSHNLKTYTVSSYEVRGVTASNVTAADLVAPAVQALEAMPSNNYYYYSINTGSITISNQNANNHTADAAVGMDSHVQEYSVYLNGTEVPRNERDGRTKYYYQEYVEPTVGDSSIWYAVNSASDTDVSNAPQLAVGTSYKFRIKGDTYLKTVAGSVSDSNFNRSEVDFSHYEMTHKGTSPTNMKEYLLQNFYIADFFSPSKVLDSDNLPYDDAEFVGGGVVYYSMTNDSPSDNALASGYVDAQGVANAANIKEMLKANIEENMPSAEVIADIGEEDAAKVAYGTEIAAQQNVENGVKTGILYRYLPLNTYQLDNNGAPLKDEKGNYVTKLNDNTFRYSNSLQSYQYVYASGNENKVTNNGRNMRLYSYYIYSYVDYDLETNLPETKYEVVLSGNYADASTYWAGNTNDPNI